MTTTPERQQIIQWIKEAVASGARQFKACETIGLCMRTYQRWIQGDAITRDKRPTAERPEPQNKLTQQEANRIIDICTDPEFADKPPSQIVPILADRGEYVASESSFYRVLKSHNLSHHRGRAKPPGTYKKPTTHTATGPNQLWSWDISYMPSIVIGRFFYLYMIEDIYSRKIVGAEVYERECGSYASELLQRTVWSEQCNKHGVVLHSDNGAPMKSFTFQAKMVDLGMIKSRSRPRVSNDNPYSESLFRTVKYCPQWPASGFKSLEAAREWTQLFVDRYNNEHQHSGIKFVTPHQRHSQIDTQILSRRQTLYELEKMKNPTRWSKATRNWSPILSVTLNPDKEAVSIKKEEGKESLVIVV